MQTKSVDESFEKILNSTLPTDGARLKFENEEVEKEEEDEKPDVPISEFTKNVISARYANCLIDDPMVATKIMSCLKHLEKMTEREGQLYLKTLANSNIYSMSESGVDLALDVASNFFVNPDRPDIKEKIKKDRMIRSSLSDKLTELYIILGSVSSVFLFLFYSIESYYTNNNESTPAIADRPETPVSSNVPS